MRIKISGTDAPGAPIHPNKIIIYEMYDEYDRISKTSSMARTTGYTCTAALQLLIRNMIKEKGVLAPEVVGKDEACFSFILNYLRDRNVIYKKEELQTN